jgi:D-alanyl-D-alanine carboxypeptidase (penicillin-binding protein 5/6)
MTTTPFMTPEKSRERRALADRRRRRRRLTLAGIACVLLAVAAVLASGILDGTGAGSGRRVATAAAHTASALPAPAVSPYGLPLAAPALALTGLASAPQDPVRLVFHHPPRAGLLVNLDSGQVLWQRNPELRVPIASLTKMMTALVTVKSTTPHQTVLITKQALETSGSKVGVLPLGRHVPMESMLYGLMLPSGNDASVALAIQVAGSVGAFVREMNHQAASLGMACTRYSSPSGFYNQGNFSCAADLAMLSRVDLAQPRIARVVHTYSAAVPFPIAGGRLYLYNNNPLLIYHYPGITGLKTGFTLAAGRCLIATAERNGVRLAAIVLNSTEPGTQAQRLLDAGFSRVYHQKPVAGPVLPPGA